MKKRNDPRHLARKVALKILFEQMFHPEYTPRQRLIAIKKNSSRTDQEVKNPDKKKKSLDNDLLFAILNELPATLEGLDRIIAECAPEWPLKQIAKVDLTILRIATFELLHHQNTPTKVAIDEAVELAKEYGGNNSSRFINGVLGSVVKKHIQAAKSEASDATGTNEPSPVNKE